LQYRKKQRRNELYRAIELALVNAPSHSRPRDESNNITALDIGPQAQWWWMCEELELEFTR